MYCIVIINWKYYYIVGLAYGIETISTGDELFPSHVLYHTMPRLLRCVGGSLSSVMVSALSGGGVGVHLFFRLISISCSLLNAFWLVDLCLQSTVTRSQPVSWLIVESWLQFIESVSKLGSRVSEILEVAWSQSSRSLSVWNSNAFINKARVGI